MQTSQPSRRDKIYRFIGKFALGIFALCLVLGAVAFGLGLSLSSADDYHINLYPSPSGHMKAAHVSHFGGGAISPYCTEAIAIGPASTAETELMAGKFNVYSSTDCDTFADQSPSPVVEWISDTTLKISFSINGTSASMRTVLLRKQDASGQVGVEFIARP